MSATPIILPASDATEQQGDNAPAPAEQGAQPAELKAAIAAADPFAGLADPIIEAVADTAASRNYSAGQTVFSMGQYDGADAFVVASGLMRVSVINPETGSVVVDDIGAGTAFAVDLTFCGDDNEVFSRLAVTAEEELTLISIDAEALRDLAGQRPSLMRNLAQYFARELGNRRFNALSVEAAPPQRVFSELLKFVERDQTTGLWRVPRMPKHRELADLADVEESVAAEAVAALIQEGVAQRDYPGLIIMDMARLNQLSG